jgi:hypothetical protein
MEVGGERLPVLHLIVAVGVVVKQSLILLRGGGKAWRRVGT